MAKRAYKWVWNARIQKESLVALRKLADGLGFIVDTPGKYLGTGSAPDLLDALAAAYRADPETVINAMRQIGVVASRPTEE